MCLFTYFILFSIFLLANPIVDIENEYKRNNYGEVNRLIDKECDNEDMMACYSMGKAYMDGLNNLPIDYKKTEQYFIKSCKLGNNGICLVLGLMYVKGQYVIQNKQKAAYFFKEACQSGSPEGCTHLAIAYTQGDGVNQNAKKAFEYYQRGCIGGDAEGCFGLAVCYNNGFGTFQDYSHTQKLLKIACSMGYTQTCRQ
jgi:TPR repeat protein